jgi:hypothetical protein
MKMLYLGCLSAALLVAPVQAQDYPKLKVGLWQFDQMQADAANPRMPNRRTEFCTDEGLQKEMFEMGQGVMKGMCSKQSFKITGGRGVGDSVCDMGGTKVTTHTTMVLNGDTGFHLEANTTFDPPMQGMKENRSLIDAKYLGGCKPGQKPGDMTLPNGQTMNVRDLLNRSGK